MSEEKLVTVTIDGQTTEVPQSYTILDAARTLNIDIPTICYDPRLKPFGSCRMCVVAVKAMRGRLTTACSTPVADGMEVDTANEVIDNVRKLIIELMLVHHPLDCPVCDKAGECTLQDLTYQYGASENRFAHFQVRSELPPETRSPMVERVPSRCILCGSCVRVCDEVQCVGEISFIRRGITAGIGTLFDKPLDCQFCGQCIDICPVGALLAKPFKHSVRVWELESTYSTCNWCGVGCHIRIDHKRGKVYRIKAELGEGVNLGNLCGKGRYGFGYIDHDKRITDPMVKKDGKLTPVSWDEALDRAAELISKPKEAQGPQSIGLIAGPRATNESLFLARELFAKHLGTPNIGGQQEDLAAASVQGAKSVLGAGSTAALSDVFSADAMLVVGVDVLDSSPVLGNRIVARSREEGVELIVVDPRRTREMTKATYPLQCAAHSADLVLEAFIATVLDEKLAAENPDSGKLRSALSDPAQAAGNAGLDLKQIQAAARAFAKAGNKVILTGPEPYNRQGSLRTSTLAADLALLTGAGLITVLEKSNLRGSVDMGMLPAENGLGYVEMLSGAGDKVRTLLVMGDDPYTHAPGGGTVRGGLDKLDGLIAIDLYENEVTKRADVVLPAAAFAEQDGTITNSEGRVQAIAEAVPKPDDVLPDWQILSRLGAKLGYSKSYEDAAALHKDMAAQEAWTGTSLPAGGEAVDLGDPPDETALVVPPQRADYSANPDYPMTLITGPLLWHSGTTSTRSKHLDDVYTEPLARLHVGQAESLGINDGDKLKIVGPDWSVEAKAETGDFVPQGMVFIPNHFSHTAAAGFFSQGRASVRVEKITGEVS